MLQSLDVASLEQAVGVPVQELVDHEQSRVFESQSFCVVRSAQGVLDESDMQGGRIAPQGKAKFDAEIKFEEGDPAEKIERVQARLVGKEE